MALLAAAMILLSSGSVTPDEQTTLLAHQVGVDPLELLGAANSTAASPMAYLVFEGLIEPPAAPVSPPAPASGVWAKLAQCESSSRWNANTGNGYFGGLQEDMTFWRTHGGLAYAPRPDLAPPAAQIAVAERGLVAQGYGAWPNCSRRLGLR